MSSHAQLPLVAVVATTSAQQPSTHTHLPSTPGLLHPDCTAGPLAASQRRTRARRGRHGWIHLLAVHSACHGCPHHARNEYGTWIADALGFDWRGWAGYLYGPLVLAGTWGTRKRPDHLLEADPVPYPHIAAALATGRRRWTTAQDALPDWERADHRLAMWHQHREWEYRTRAAEPGTTGRV